MKKNLNPYVSSPFEEDEEMPQYRVPKAPHSKWANIFPVNEHHPLTNTQSGHQTYLRRNQPLHTRQIGRTNPGMECLYDVK